MADDETRRTETVTVEDGSNAARLSLPASGSGPGVLLLQEIFGVNDFLEGKAADLARLGYVVLAPDVFWRIEPDVALAHDEAGLQAGFELMGRYQAEVDLDTKASDLVAAFDHLRSLPETRGRKDCVMGYCLGGFLAYLTAAHADTDACVSYYGSGIAGVLSMADRVRCPVLFHFGGKDPFIPDEQVTQIRAAFADRQDVTVRVEPEAGHAFENLLAPQFGMAEPAARSWAATVEWLGEHLA